MKLFLALLIMLPLVVPAQSKGPLLITINKKEQCGYKDSKGKMVVPYGKYEYCFTDTFQHFAFVADKDSGIVAIDRKGKVLFHAYVLDNGPDPQDARGFFRIKIGGMTGFADADGRIVIEPVYNDAESFMQDSAKVYQENDVFYINRKGERIRK